MDWQGIIAYKLTPFQFMVGLVYFHVYLITYLLDVKKIH